MLRKDGSEMLRETSGTKTRADVAARVGLAVVIVNYKTPELTIRCVESVLDDVRARKDVAVIVVDNNSPDDSTAILRNARVCKQWPDSVHIVANSFNGGFSYGYNRGFREIDADAYLMMNSDTIARKGALQQLLTALNSDPSVGLAGPRLEDLDGKPQTSCFRWITPVSEFINACSIGVVTRLLRRFNVPIDPTDDVLYPSWISFACCVIRRDVIDDVGELDEEFFMYFEDVEFCYRAAQSGWRILYWPEARVVHLRGQSSPVKALTARRKRRPSYYYASRARYFAKVYGISSLWLANILWTMGYLVACTRAFIEGRDVHTCECEWRDIWTNALRRQTQAVRTFKGDAK